MDRRDNFNDVLTANVFRQLQIISRSAESL